MKNHDRKFRLAIIGAGAITEENYLPAAKEIPHVEIAYLVDKNKDRAIKLAKQFQVPIALRNYHELFGKVDAVVVATPPNSHAKISIDCMNADIPVLCEKPLAPTLTEAREMVEVSKKTGIYLAVTINRRLSRSAQLLKQLISNGLLGEPTHFNIAEGYEFRWPLRTGHIFLNTNHRGIISDIGPHSFDLLLWLFNQPQAKIKKCEDDNWGGIETNANVGLEMVCGDRVISGQIEFSWTRMLHNCIRIYGEKGMLEASVFGSTGVYYYPNNDLTGKITIKETDDGLMTANYGFIKQLVSFADAIKNSEEKYMSADEALATTALIEDCYRLRKLKPSVWEIKWLESLFKSSADAS
jgi:predicted dehydrogenase